MLFAAMPSAADSSGSMPKEKSQTTASAETWSPPVFEERQAERDKMVGQTRAYGLQDPEVFAAMAAVPRH
jgi:hypothetical protein